MECADSPVCDEQFLPLLADFGLEVLERDAGTIYGLWPDLTLAYLNPAWKRFAQTNGGEPMISEAWGLGRKALNAIADPLKPFFLENYERCLKERRPWEHAYECSSSEVYREFQCTTFPLTEGQGLLVVHSLRREEPYSRQSLAADEPTYCNQHGLIIQCCHCRRVMRQAGDHAWDWVASWVAKCPENTSHGLCSTCFAYYYSPDILKTGKIPRPFSTR